jgi:hypothetical protein
MSGPTQEMTSEQEEVFYRSLAHAGWEFEMWDGDDLIIQRWDRGIESSKILAALRIKPDGLMVGLSEKEAK